MVTEWGPGLERRECTLRRAHKGHSWYSRSSDIYFYCPGHHGKTPIQPRRKS